MNRQLDRMIRAGVCWLLVQLAVYSPAIAGLSGYWPLDEGSGSLAGDLSFYRTNGTVYGAAWVKGEGCYALEFSEQGDLVSLPARDIMQFEDSLTISAWVYPYDRLEGTILDCKTRYSGYMAGFEDGKLILRLRSGIIPLEGRGAMCAGDYRFSTDVAILQERKWSHVVYVYNVARDEVSFYCNGAKVTGPVSVQATYGAPREIKRQTRGAVSYEPYLPVSHIVIGCSANWPGLYGQYKGLMSSLRVYDQGLSAAEIKAQYAAQAPGFSGLKIAGTEERKAAAYTAELLGAVCDADTGIPLEATVSLRIGNDYFVSDENISWGKSGSEKPSGFITTGRFTVRVPPGRIHLEITRGPEYLPLVQDLEIRGNEHKRITLSLKRLVDMPAHGWWGGAHHEHSWGHGKQSPYEKLISADGWKYYAAAKKADGFNYVSQPRPYTGGDYQAVQTDRFICHPTLEDQICAIGTDKASGGRDTVACLEYLVKAGGHGLIQGYGGDDLQPGQVAVAMALDKIDSWQANEEDWFRYLNLGFKSCIGYGSDYYFTYGFTRNMAREYSRMPRLTWADMVEAYKQHATFLTTGPLVIFKINGREIGDNVILSGANQILSISLSAWNCNGLKKAELIRNGQVAKTLVWSDNPRQVKENFQLRADRTGWCMVRVYGAEGGYAITSPIYLQVGQQPLPQPGAGDIGHFLGYIAAYRKYLEKDSPGHNRQKELADAVSAESVYKSLLSSPRSWLDDKSVIRN